MKDRSGNLLQVNRLFTKEQKYTKFSYIKTKAKV